MATLLSCSILARYRFRDCTYSWALDANLDSDQPLQVPREVVTEADSHGIMPAVPSANCLNPKRREKDMSTVVSIKPVSKIPRLTEVNWESRFHQPDFTNCGPSSLVFKWLRNFFHFFCFVFYSLFENALIYPYNCGKTAGWNLYLGCLCLALVCVSSTAAKPFFFPVSIDCHCELNKSASQRNVKWGWVGIVALCLAQLLLVSLSVLL